MIKKKPTPSFEKHVGFTAQHSEIIMQQVSSPSQHLVKQVVGIPAPKRHSYYTNPSKKEQMPSMLLVAYVHVRDTACVFLLILMFCTAIYSVVKALASVFGGL